MRATVRLALLASPLLAAVAVALIVRAGTGDDALTVAGDTPVRSVESEAGARVTEAPSEPKAPPAEVTVLELTEAEEATAPTKTAAAPAAMARVEAVSDADKARTGAFMAVGAGSGSAGYARAVTTGGRAADPVGAGEGYSALPENPLQAVAQHPLSTFAVDVDTASYSNVRRFLEDGRLPPKDAVRIEELLNYFPLAPAPAREPRPFAVRGDLMPCPWAEGRRLVRIVVAARDVDLAQAPPCALTFLVDTSGSMSGPGRLERVQASLRLLVERLRPQDRVALATYAGSAGLVLPSTAGDQRATILGAIDRLRAGGSTAGGAGIRLAYATARQSFIQGGANRVILCTDGDFNVGVRSPAELEALIAEEAKSGVFLSVLGYGMGNLQDNRLELLADKGNGMYAYIDSMNEARKVLVEQLAGTLLTVAKDVKIQIEPNPARVASWRLIGYENRVLAAEDFRNDAKDAGEIGAGHAVTAMYELVPAEAASGAHGRDDAYDWLTVRLRWKAPDAERADELAFAVRDGAVDLEAADEDARFAAAVAAYGMLLKGSAHAGTADWAMVRRLASGGRGEDRGGHRAEFLRLVWLAEQAR